MKNQILLLILLLVSWLSNETIAQRNCEEYSQSIDSTHTLFWNKNSMLWEISTIRHYEYSNGKISSFVNLNPITRDSISEWEYHYNAEGIRTHDLYFSWANYTRNLIQKKEYEYNTNLQQTREFITNWINDTWTWRANQLFIYDGSNIDSVIYQLKDKKGTIYIFSNTVYLYENQRLSKVVTKRGSDGYVTKIANYTWNNSNQVVEIIYLEPFKNPSTNTTEYLQTTKRIYSYDIYSLLKEVRSQLWINDEWVDYAKEIYFRKIDFARKVSICHKGKDICVDRHAVPAFLKQGSTIGKCVISSSKGSVSFRQKAENTLNKTISVFPNPAVNSFTVVGLDENVKRIDLYNSMGQIVNTFNYFENTEFTVNRNGLPAGIYFLNIVTENNVSTQRVIFN